MLNNYWTLSLRNLLKHKSHTLLNVVGLAAAIASSIIIILYARNELSYDAFHENVDRIQLVYKERNTAQGIRQLDDTWVPLLDALSSQYPAVVGGVRITSRGGNWLQLDNKKFNEEITYADPSLFDVFSFSLLQGDEETALQGRNSMLLSQTMAEKLFPGENPLGKRVSVGFTSDYLITGILESIPQNSSLRPDIIVPFESLIPIEQLEAANSNWGGSFLQTYLLLDENQSAESLESQLPGFVLNTFGEEGVNGTQNMKLKLWSLRSYHDRNVNSDNTSYVLLAIALAIILIASVNFMNLSVARSLDRAKEVGMRKTLGATRRQLIFQFLSESMIVSGLALALGIGAAVLLLPVFNGLFDLELTLGLFGDEMLLLVLLLIWFLSGLLSGAYPALVLSRYTAMESLKGSLKSSPKGLLLRNSLSFLQFGIAIVLVVGMMVVGQQVRYMKSQNLNFSPEQVLVIPVRLGDFSDETAAISRLQVFKREISRLPAVASVSSSMSVPGSYRNANVFARPEDWQQDEPLRMLIAGADDAYFETYDIAFLEGRDFSRSIATESNSIILNETAMRDMGWDTAIGKKVNDWTVVGVVEDFHYQSLENDIAAVIHLYGAQDSRNHAYVSIKLDTTDLASTLLELEEQWELLDPSRPFEYRFMEEEFEGLYRDVDNMSTIIIYFALLSIIVANLGVLGLASYTVIQRTKEIGIRKVLGGSIKDIVLLLVSQFTKPVLLANLVAWPIAYLALSRWLQSFAYHVEISLITFPLAGLCILLLSLLTIASQSISAAAANPVNSLRAE